MPAETAIHGRIAAQVRDGVGQEETDKPQREQVDFYRVSETSKCDRRVYYARTSEPVSNPFPPETIEKMKKGELLHDHLRDLITKHSGWTVGRREEEFTGIFKVGDVNVKLVGHTDGVLSSKRSRRPIGILEVKTTSDWSYKQIVKLDFKDPSHYSAGYLLQGNRYVHLYNLMDTKTKLVKRHMLIRSICICIYNVNGTVDDLTGFPMRDYWFAADTELFHRDMRRLAAIERNVIDGKIPERYYQKITWECTGCLWFDTCWPVAAERIYADARLSSQAKRASETRGSAHR